MWNSHNSDLSGVENHIMAKDVLDFRNEAWKIAMK